MSATGFQPVRFFLGIEGFPRRAAEPQATPELTHTTGEVASCMDTPRYDRAMRVLLQRVTAGSVTVDDQVVGAIGRGVVLLVGINDDDDQATVDRMAEKIVNLRIFSDDAGKFNHSLLDVGGEALVVSQFTLFADTKKGRRPSFTGACRPEHASPLCDYLSEKLRSLGVTKVATGSFGAMMKVSLINDGPVTIWMDSQTWKP